MHLRSVDDEYEHLESTLPSRARTGGAAGGVGGTPAAEEVESGAGAGETRERPDGTANEDGGDGDGDGGGNGAVDGDSGGNGDADGRSENGVGPTPEEHRECDGDDDAGGDNGLQGDTFREQRRPEHNFPGESGDRDESPPAASVPFGEQDEANHHNPHVARGGSWSEDRRHDTHAEWSAAVGGDAAERHPLPSSPLPYHYRSPSCSPRLSPRPARSPYRQEGVGERVSSGRGEVRRGQRQEELAQKDNSHFTRGDVSSLKGSEFRRLDVESEKGQAGESSRADVTGAWDNAATGYPGSKVPAHGRENGGTSLDAKRAVHCASPIATLTPRAGLCGSRDTPILPGCVGQVGDCVRPEIRTDIQQPKRHPGTSSPAGSTRRRSGADTAQEQTFWANNDGNVDDDGKGSVDWGGFGNKHGGSVVFFDNQDGQGEGVGDEGKSDGEEGWWQPESGSVLQGLEFSFQRDPSSVVCGTSGTEVRSSGVVHS